MTSINNQFVVPRRPLTPSSWRQPLHRQSSRLASVYRWQTGSINSTTISLAFGLLIIASVFSLGFFYLGQVLNTASQGSDIQQLEEKIVELKEQQRQVELEGARLRSIDNIEERVHDLNLVATSKVTFLNPSVDNVVALNH